MIDWPGESKVLGEGGRERERERDMKQSQTGKSIHACNAHREGHKHFESHWQPINTHSH